MCPRDDFSLDVHWPYLLDLCVLDAYLMGIITAIKYRISANR